MFDSFDAGAMVAFLMDQCNPDHAVMAAIAFPPPYAEVSREEWASFVDTYARTLQDMYVNLVRGQWERWRETRPTTTLNTVCGTELISTFRKKFPGMFNNVVDHREAGGSDKAEMEQIAAEEPRDER